MWFVQVFESLGISWQTFVTQAAALALWICLAAIVYSVIEALVNRLDDEQAALLNAYVIWLFFGIAGAHRVYFGRIGSGLAFLVLVTIAALAGLGLGTLPYLASPWAIGEIMSIPVALWLIFVAVLLIWYLRDAFLLPDWVRTARATEAEAVTSS